jgi:hypothetical protein
LFLYKALAEAPAANDGGAVPFLQSPGKHFTRRSRTFIEQHHQLPFFKQTPPAAFVFPTWMVNAFGVNNEFISGKKFIGHLYRFIQDATAIFAKVKNQFGHALALALSKS